MVSHAPAKGAGSQRSPISICAYTFCRRTTKFDVVTPTGRGLLLGGQPNLHPKGVPAIPNLGFFSIYAYIFCRRTTEFDTAIHLGQGLVSWSQPRLPSQEIGSFSAPQLVGFSCIYAYTTGP